MPDINMGRPYAIYSTRGGEFQADAEGIVYNVPEGSQAYFDLLNPNGGKVIPTPPAPVLKPGDNVVQKSSAHPVMIVQSVNGTSVLCAWVEDNAPRAASFSASALVVPAAAGTSQAAPLPEPAV
jgi:uncharacterized protein YodC (DUF2158 family)